MTHCRPRPCAVSASDLDAVLFPDREHACAYSVRILRVRSADLLMCQRANCARVDPSDFEYDIDIDGHPADVDDRGADDYDRDDVDEHEHEHDVDDMAGRHDHGVTDRAPDRGDRQREARRVWWRLPAVLGMRARVALHVWDRVDREGLHRVRVFRQVAIRPADMVDVRAATRAADVVRRRRARLVRRVSPGTVVAGHAGDGRCSDGQSVGSWPRLRSVGCVQQMKGQR